ncbi:Helix-turn-helix domain-containing protein [Arachidicoccus rhizosphaerae]|uniref:Helix-turn-helix domain-containing protein n=1 Tax=Arachidicoccus rhizosphaerae TaxID=551991 RepID=A0A1H3ZI26_9BACT|nr:helix-turn-helix domain-containing protein [Arachidicoccus rhizosphaerae]SEA23218.1 Helix-turn-helix domain-containing protein [Arachidicoccus rhizosphaerae]
MSEQQKIFLSENIGFLRKRRKLTQQQLAQLLDFTREKMRAIEKGATKNPSVEDLVKFSDFFKLSVDSLLKVNLTKLQELQLRELEAGNDVYMTGSRIRVLPITVDVENRQNCEYVPIKAKMGYSSGYNDPEYISSLPKYNDPSLSRTGTYRTFQAEGDSMYPVPDKAEVTGAYIENWLAIKQDTPCIVILKGANNFVFKLVTVNKNEKNFLLKSLNPLYKPYIIEVDDVLEFWEFKKMHLDRLPEQPTEMQELKGMFNDLKIEIAKLKK